MTRRSRQPAASHRYGAPDGASAMGVPAMCVGTPSPSTTSSTGFTNLRTSGRWSRRRTVSVATDEASTSSWVRAATSIETATTHGSTDAWTTRLCVIRFHASLVGDLEPST